MLCLDSDQLTFAPPPTTFFGPRHFIKERRKSHKIVSNRKTVSKMFDYKLHILTAEESAYTFVVC